MTAWLAAHVDLYWARDAAQDWAFCCVEDLVLTQGQWFTPARLPDRRLRGPEGLCFANAAG